MNKLIKLALEVGVDVALECVGEVLDCVDEILKTDMEDGIKVGDFVQWESNGQYMFNTPKKIVNIEDSEFAKR